MVQFPAGPVLMPKISISYRRANSEAMTGRIFDRLIAHYGKEAIFRDIDDIPAGIDFRVHINEILRSTHILLAIVGPSWLGAAQGGAERIQEEADPVRVEVETALRRRVPIVPVLIGSTRMPSSDQLPPSLKDFAFRNAVKIDTGQDFDYHMDRLIKAMDTILSQAPKPPPSRETKVPSPAARQSTAERQAAAALTDTPRRKDTGSRATAPPAASAEAAGTGKTFSFASALPSDWREQLWPENRQGRVMRLSIAGAVAVLLMIVAIVAFSGGSGGSGQRLLTLSGHSGAVTALAFAPGGRTLVSGSADKSLKIWDAVSGQVLKTLTGDTETVSTVAFLPSGKRIVSGSFDRTVIIWDANTGEAIRSLRSDQTYSWEVPPAMWSVTTSPGRHANRLGQRGRQHQNLERGDRRTAACAAWSFRRRHVDCVLSKRQGARLRQQGRNGPDLGCRHVAEPRSYSPIRPARSFRSRLRRAASVLPQAAVPIPSPYGTWIPGSRPARSPRNQAHSTLCNFPATANVCSPAAATAMS